MSRAPLKAESCVELDFDLFLFQLTEEDLEFSHSSTRDLHQLLAGHPCGRTPLNRRAQSYIPIADQDAQCPSVSSHSCNRPRKPVLDAAGPYSLPSTNANGCSDHRFPCGIHVTCVPPVMLVMENSLADGLSSRGDSSVRSDALDSNSVADSGCERLPPLEDLPSCPQPDIGSDCSVDLQSWPYSSCKQDHASSGGDSSASEGVASSKGKKIQNRVLVPIRGDAALKASESGKTIAIKGGRGLIAKLRKEPLGKQLHKEPFQKFLEPRGAQVVQDRKQLWNALALEIPASSNIGYETGRF